ncbi:MAG: hypothetical protein Q8P41_06560 [Pseudomonadota bacterium]|nr:hypothetical protein [Pseudomonadota bacterium]
MQAERWMARADRHTRIRWIGAAAFCVAAVVMAGGLSAIVTGQAPLKLLPWCILAMGLSLGAFGTNDDTALHALAELSRQGAVPARHQAEWDHERKVRGARIQGLHTHPKTSFVLPILALAALSVAASRVGAAWGLIS